MKLLTREQWGALPATRSSTIQLPVPRLWLHHTASTDRGVLSVRSAQRYHLSRGWNDIGYSWLYSPKWRTFYEGRGAGVAGAHTKGDNFRSHALCVIGNYEVSTLPWTAIDDLAEFLAWHAKFGPSQFTGGHRDAPGASTSCPGRNLYKLLPTINRNPAPPKGDTGQIKVPLAKPAPDTTTEEAEVKELVTGIQEALKTAGFDPGAVDGYWGPKTQAAFARALAKPIAKPAAKASPSVKSVSQLADEVIAGKHGQGHETRRKSLGLSKSGYAKVRAEVNRRF